MIYLELFLGFLRVGCFAFGGAYGAIPLIREVVVSYGWLTEEELTYMIAVSESTPGPIMVNLATYVGSSQAGLAGAVLATLAVVLPSFIIILLVTAILKTVIKNKYAQAVLGGLKPCIAGIILSIGMAVDANVIIYARIREEIAAGRSVRGSIKEGFHKALSAILDGNITTLIAAFVLNLMGSGSVKGFAQTLALGIVLSMFTALVISRLLVTALYELGFKDEKYYGKEKKRKIIDFVGMRRVTISVSSSLWSSRVHCSSREASSSCISSLCMSSPWASWTSSSRAFRSSQQPFRSA